MIGNKEPKQLQKKKGEKAREKSAGKWSNRGTAMSRLQAPRKRQGLDMAVPLLVEEDKLI